MAARKKKSSSKKPETPDDILDDIQASIEGRLDGDHKGVVIRRMSDDHAVKFDAVPFGIAPLDAYLHGGIPTGRITEIYGPESSGKTTLCYHAMAVMSNNPGDVCLYIDSEHGFDAIYAQRIGVVLDRVIIMQPDYGEQAFNAIYGFCEEMGIRRQGYNPKRPLKSKSGRRYPYEKLAGGPWKGKACVLVDSVAALVPKAEHDRVTDGDFEGQNPAEQARMMSRQLRPLVRPIAQGDVAALFTNQIREKVNVRFGSPQTTPGGNALKFYASSRWSMGHRGYLRRGSGENGKIIGRECAIQVVKCRLFDPFAPELKLPFTARGIDLSSVVFDALRTLEVIRKSGSWYQIHAPGHAYHEMKWQGTNGYDALVEDGTLDVKTLEELARNS